MCNRCPNPDELRLTFLAQEYAAQEAMNEAVVEFVKAEQDEDEQPETCDLCEQILDGDCMCWSCQGCDHKYTGDDRPCSNCARCADCCSCWYCRGCQQQVSEDVMQCSNCARCTEACCECSYCESCSASVSNTCSNCNQCEECCGGCSDRGAAVHEYGYQPRFTFHHEEDETEDSSQFYGIELEVNGSQDLAEDVESRMDGHAYNCEDGSVNHGFEIITHPHSFRSMRRLWTEYFKRPVKGLSSFKSGECGLHIHIGRNNLTEAQIRRMVVFLNAPENTPFVERIAQRSNSSFCKIKNKPMTKALNQSDRYEALNLRNSATVELRIFRGSYRLDRVLKALDFADALVEFTRDRSYRELTVDAFTLFLKANRKRYKWLWSFLSGEAMPTTSKPDSQLSMSFALPLPTSTNEV